MSDDLTAELERTRIGLVVLRAVMADLLNQLTLLTRDDETYLWRIGGRPLDDAYKAVKRVTATDHHPGAALLRELEAARELKDWTRKWQRDHIISLEMIRAMDAMDAAEKASSA